MTTHLLDYLIIICLLCACNSTSSTPQPTQSILAISTTLLPAATATSIQPTSVTWLTYTHPSGVSFRYPSDKQLDLSRLDQGEVRLMTEGIPITIFIDGQGSPRDLVEFYQQDRRKKHGQNEDNAGIRWLSELRLPGGVVGYMYVWGPSISMSDQLLGGELDAQLIRVKPSEQQLQTRHYVGVTWPINRESDLQYATEHGIEKMVKDRGSSPNLWIAPSR